MGGGFKRAEHKQGERRILWRIKVSGSRQFFFFFFVVNCLRSHSTVLARALHHKETTTKLKTAPSGKTNPCRKGEVDEEVRWGMQELSLCTTWIPVCKKQHVQLILRLDGGDQSHANGHERSGANDRVKSAKWVPDWMSIESSINFSFSRSYSVTSLFSSLQVDVDTLNHYGYALLSSSYNNSHPSPSRWSRQRVPSDQPITCQQLLGVGSRRPAGVEVEGKRSEVRSNWLLEQDDEFAAAGKVAGVMETCLWTLMICEWWSLRTSLNFWRVGQR